MRTTTRFETAPALRHVSMQNSDRVRILHSESVTVIPVCCINRDGVFVRIRSVGGIGRSPTSEIDR